MAIVSSQATDLAPNQEVTREKSGLKINRYFTRAGISPYDEVEWEHRTATITNEKGKIVFEQANVDIPKAWSMMATQVVVSKYFRGPLGTPQRETSVRQMITRVVETIANWGRKDSYFAAEEDAQAFADELTHILLHQKACFNSPVWFNCGVEAKPQCSACFINSVEDTMDLDPRPGQDGRHAVQVGLRHGQQSLPDPFFARATVRRRHGFGSGFLHEGL